MTHAAVLIETTELREHLADPDWAIVDCRFDLRDTGAGETAYRASHIAGAVYAHLDRDLSGPIVPGTTGRHPLPSAEAFAATASACGIDDATEVVAYDASGGAIAARLWWLLRWLGHEKVRVLNGGWAAWTAHGGPTAGGDETRPPRAFRGVARDDLVIDAGALDGVRESDAWRVCDARAADRFRGENETLDPVAGHIPGAISVPFADNLGPDGRFRSPDELRQRFESVMDGIPAANAVFYCGSGVTAAHNVLAMAHAGLGLARLYPGSWSEWITDPSRPVA